MKKPNQTVFDELCQAVKIQGSASRSDRSPSNENNGSFFILQPLRHPLTRGEYEIITIYNVSENRWCADERTRFVYRVVRADGIAECAGCAL